MQTMHLHSHTRLEITPIKQPKTIPKEPIPSPPRPKELLAMADAPTVLAGVGGLTCPTLLAVTIPREVGVVVCWPDCI